MGCDAETSRRNGAKSRGPITERGKEIASRNATKHGLLAEKPPILASEDLETFQGIVQGLVDQYQPEGPLEWHCVQTIAMCIQRQHRAWAAEAALGNAELLPPVPAPYTNKKYPAQKSIDMDFGMNTEFHPQNLKQERKLLTLFLQRHPIENFPTGLRSKYWAQTWDEWQKLLKNDLKDLQRGYPIDLDQLRDKNRASDWLRELSEKNHPFARVFDYQPRLRDEYYPTSKYLWRCEHFHFEDLLDCFRGRLQKIDEIEQEIADEKERYRRESEERRLATTNSISKQIILISRYESHISKQMEKAISQLTELQSRRKT